jgi:hypothetical protein
LVTNRLKDFIQFAFVSHRSKVFRIDQRHFTMNGGGGGGGGGPAAGLQRDSTVVVSLSKYAKDPAVVEMLQMAADDWGKLACFANDAMHIILQAGLRDNRPRSWFPDVTTPGAWLAVVKCFYQLHKVPAGGAAGARHPDWSQILVQHMWQHNTDFNAAFHTNQLEALAQLEAQACAMFNRDQNLSAHISRYIQGRYGFAKGHAKWIANRVLRRDRAPDFEETTIPRALREQSPGGAAFVMDVVVHESQRYNDMVPLAAEDERPQALLQYRHFLLHQLDQVADDACKRFSLIPFHACGSAQHAHVTGNYLRYLARKVRTTHNALYLACNAAEAVRKANNDNNIITADENNPYKLRFYFDGLDKLKTGGWQLGRSVRTDGISLHVLFEKGKAYRPDGRPLKAPRSHIATPKTWNLPKAPRAPPCKRHRARRRRSRPSHALRRLSVHRHLFGRQAAVRDPPREKDRVRPQVGADCQVPLCGAARAPRAQACRSGHDRDYQQHAQDRGLRPLHGRHCRSAQRLCRPARRLEQQARKATQIRYAPARGARDRPHHQIHHLGRHRRPRHR